MYDIATMNARGMITIPSRLRKKLNLKEGTRFMVLQMEDGISIIPIQNENELRDDLIGHDDLVRAEAEAKTLELELEDR